MPKHEALLAAERYLNAGNDIDGRSWDDYAEKFGIDGACDQLDHVEELLEELVKEFKKLLQEAKVITNHGAKTMNCQICKEEGVEKNGNHMMTLTVKRFSKAKDGESVDVTYSGELYLCRSCAEDEREKFEGGGLVNDVTVEAKVNYLATLKGGDEK